MHDEQIFALTAKEGGTVADRAIQLLTANFDSKFCKKGETTVKFFYLAQKNTWVLMPKKTKRLPSVEEAVDFARESAISSGWFNVTKKDCDDAR